MTEKSEKPANGGVVWITGLSGAGKSTIAGLLRDELLLRGIRPVWIDGNRFRALLPWNFGFSPRERLNVALYYSQLSQELAEQGQLVICSTISLFADIHSRNRAHIPNYFEVLLRASAGELTRRDTRNIYKGTSNTEPVVGVTCRADFPQSPHLVVDNEPPVSPDQTCEQIKIALLNTPWMRERY